MEEDDTKNIYIVSEVEKRHKRKLTEKEISELQLYNKRKDKSVSDLCREYEQFVLEEERRSDCKWLSLRYLVPLFATYFRDGGRPAFLNENIYETNLFFRNSI